MATRTLTPSQRKSTADARTRRIAAELATTDMTIDDVRTDSRLRVGSTQTFVSTPTPTAAAEYLRNVKLAGDVEIDLRGDALLVVTWPFPTATR